MVDKVQKDIKVRFKSLDNTYKLRGNASFTNILNYIDENKKEAEESKIKKFFSIAYNTAMLRAKGSESKTNFLESIVDEISHNLTVYELCYNNVYKVDKTFLDWVQDTDIFGDEYIDRIPKLDRFLLECNNVMYYCYIENEEDNEFVDLFINIVVNNNDDLGHLDYSVQYRINKYEDVATQTMVRELHCGNQNCPHYKSSISQEILSKNKKVYKKVFCGKECINNKCNYIEDNGYFDFKHLLHITCGILFCKYMRVYPKYNTQKKEYEHLPMPMNTEDVVIRLGNIKTSQEIEDFVNQFEFKPCEVGVVGSHASPRSHTRRGGNRKAFERVRNGKVEKVRATTFKSTVVNKHLEPTTYKVKD